jgi:hypothetical protein
MGLSFLAQPDANSTAEHIATAIIPEIFIFDILIEIHSATSQKDFGPSDWL